MELKKPNTKNLGTGFLYFYVHFVTELICFFVLSSYIESAPVAWLIAVAYDMLAFTPQSVIGYVSDRFRRIPFGVIGLALLAIAVTLQQTASLTFVSLTILCIGNACTHVNGAEVTLRTANGSLSHSAIFVAGGSFGVISGKLLAALPAPLWLLLLLTASAVPFALAAEEYLKKPTETDPVPCRAFRYNDPRRNKYLVILLSVIVVICRGYMAYGIPISWRKTTLQTVMLFCFMGVGKALGGVFSDMFGIKKTAVTSLMLALPFLLFGDNNMYVSLLGVMFFSMTMSVTLAVIVSVLPKAPGLAFGFTTIGLFLGAAPVFFIKVKGFLPNCIMLTVMTAVCVGCMLISIRKDERHGKLV